MNITRSAIEQNRVTLVAILFVVLAGLMAYRTLPRAEDPGFPIRSAMVITYFPGASPERVELLVSDKLEKAIQEMPELDSVKSKNKTGVSIITVNLKSQYKDLRPIWDSLRRKVDGARGDLPEGVAGPFVNDEFGDVFGIIVGVKGDGYSYAELKEVADELRDELLALPDAAKVELYGVQDERIFIEYKNERLAEVGLSPGQLQQILTAQNIVTAGGRIRVGEERYALEPTGNYESVEDIENTLLSVPGRPEVIPLKDIARVERGYVDPSSSMFHDTGTPGLALAISMRDGGNITELGDQVEAQLPQIEATYPIGVEFDVLVFQPRDVSNLVDGFVTNLLQAIGIVMLSMVVFLGIRTGLVVATLIPVAITSALFVMSLLGVGLDQMSLASLIIALGLLVDNAVVMAESTMVQMENGKRPIEAAVDSANELKVPLLTSSLTTCAAFLPIFLAKSETGEYTAPLFVVVSITLLCSWLLAITLTPVLCTKFIRVKPRQEEVPFESRFYRGYRRILMTGLRRPVIVMVGVVAMFFALGRGFAAVPKIFFPPSDHPSFTVELELPQGTSIETTQETAKRLENFMARELQVSASRESGVSRWATFVGQGGPRFYLGYTPEPNNAAYLAMIVSATDRPAAEHAVREVRSFVREQLPDARATVRPRALGPSSKAPLMYELSGRDTDTLFAHVAALKEKLGSLAGPTNIRDDWGPRVKKLVVDIDESRARRAGLSNQDIAVSLQTVLSGIDITEYREGDEKIPVTLRSVAADRQDIGKIENLAVYAQSSGKSVPLSQVADVRVVWEASDIRRSNRAKTVTVLANLESGVTADEVDTVVMPWLDEQQGAWPRGYRWEIGGEAKNSTKANESIGDQLPVAALIILMLLVWQFNSIRRPLIILFTVPLGVVGVVIGLIVFRSYFGFMTLLGIISLAGIVINNAIVLIDRIDTNVRDRELPPAQAIVEAAQSRLRPILLTTATTILGLLPLWLASSPMWEPLAIGIICGLTFSTLLTLGVVPVFYSLLFRVRFEGFEYTPPSPDAAAS